MILNEHILPRFKPMQKCTTVQAVETWIEENRALFWTNGGQSGPLPDEFLSTVSLEIWKQETQEVVEFEQELGDVKFVRRACPFLRAYLYSKQLIQRRFFVRTGIICIGPDLAPTGEPRYSVVLIGKDWAPLFVQLALEKPWQ